jgi:Ser/Thr protein kinase RdoA (MazF antagonist)
MRLYSKDTAMKKPSFTSKCSKWREKWPRISHKSLRARGERVIEMADRAVVAAIIKKPQSKMQRNWDSTLVRVVHQDSRITRKRIKLLRRVPGKLLTKPII